MLYLTSKYSQKNLIFSCLLILQVLFCPSQADCNSTESPGSLCQYRVSHSIFLFQKNKTVKHCALLSPTLQGKCCLQYNYWTGSLRQSISKAQVSYVPPHLFQFCDLSILLHSFSINMGILIWLDSIEENIHPCLSCY